jgi:acetate---CoA ligase (ADP-forming) subunit beta
MHADALIQAAVDRNQRALSEYDSKKLLARYEIPVTREGLAQSRDEAVSLAEALGWPVAVKACGPELMHKSEGGWVKLGLATPDDVRQAYGSIMSSAPGSDGVLVQEMIHGQRELVLGLKQDPQFGPCVMVGLGGVMTEVFKDTAFRMAPLDMIDARDMVSELKCSSMLHAFRGQHPVDMDTLCGSLVALGQIGLEHERIAEIDVNPMIIGANGRVTAVDALVVLERTYDAGQH